MDPDSFRGDIWAPRQGKDDRFFMTIMRRSLETQNVVAVAEHAVGGTASSTPYFWPSVQPSSENGDHASLASSAVSNKRETRSISSLARLSAR
jgi:hypothetical protein